MQIISPWMVPVVSRAIIGLPLFGVVVTLFAMFIFTSTVYLLSILFLDTYHLLTIAPLLFMTYFYMTTSLTLSLPKILYLVALLSLTAQRHRLIIHIRLHSEKPHPQM